MPPQPVLKGHSLELGLQSVCTESGVRFPHKFAGFQMLIPVFSSLPISSWNPQALEQVPVTEGGGVGGRVSNWGPAGKSFPTATREDQLCRERKTETSLCFLCPFLTLRRVSLDSHFFQTPPTLGFQG